MPLIRKTLEQQLEYWRARLAGAPGGLELPADRARPPVRLGESARRSRTLPLDLTAALEALTRREGATLFAGLFAALAGLLARYSGQSDIVIGSPSLAGCAPRGTGQPAPGLLPLRVDLSDDPAVCPLLRRMCEAAEAACAHADVPLDALRDALGGPSAQRSASPFQVVMALAGHDPAPIKGAAGCDWLLTVHAGPDGWVADLDYATDLFDAATVDRMLGHWQRLIEGMVADPARRVSQLDMLTDAERHQVLVEWNRTQRDYPRDPCVHHLFQALAARTPDALAVVFEDRSLTYRELDARSDCLARYLRGLGVGPEVLVGIGVERSPEMVVGLLGILKAGGAYVPLDPAYPPDRLAFMLEDADVGVLLTQSHLCSAWPAGRTRRVCLDSDWPAIEACGHDAPPAEVGPHHLAYVIYTSGSTGKPKGVQVLHGGLVNFLVSMADCPGLGCDDVVLGLTTLSFDIAGLELYLPLISGARIELVGRELAQDGPRLAALLEARGVTLMQATPATWRLLIETGWAGRPALRILCGGEALPRALADQLLRSGGEVWNVYGPTETTIWSTVGRVFAGPSPVSIGRPIANTQVYILDSALQPVPPGVSGELCIGGDGLARGYLNRPELTAEKFVVNPFGPGRIYRTGDLARFLPDGSIECLGRLDHQVKIRGFRIELGEIEAALARHPAVRQNVVVAREDAPGDKRLVAYVVSARTSGPSADELRAHLAGQLPEYMVPSAFVVMERLPLTPNGKVDRKALPAPAAGAYQREVLPARDELDRVLIGWWEELLKVAPVGVGDTFVALGGHSLLAAVVCARARETWGVELPIRRLLDSSKLSDLADWIRDRRSGPGPEAAPLARAAVRSDLPLSAGQRRLWLLHRLYSLGGTYNEPLGVRLAGPLDPARLERAVNAVVARHEILRTRFVALDGEPRQVIEPRLNVPVALHDLSGLPEGEREPAGRRAADQAASQQFDLAAGPLLRVNLLRLADQDHVLVVTMHHIICDDWSDRLFLEELTAAYAGASPVMPDEPSLQYGDFAAWQRRSLTPAECERQVAYWRQHLEGAPPVLELPSDRVRPAAQTFRGARHHLALPAVLVERLREVGREQQATLFMTLLAAYAVLLRRYSGQEDLVIGTPYANRDRPEVQRLLGFFLNMLPLRVDLRADPAFRELLASVRESAIAAHEHQDVPFERLVEELQPRRDARFSPLFQVVFVLLNEPPPVPRLPGVVAQPFPVHTGTAKFDLTLFLNDGPDGMEGCIEYNADLYEAEAVARLAESWRVLLEGIAADPSLPVSRLPVLAQRDRELLLSWAGESRPYPREATIHALFEEQCRRTPERVALDFRNEACTYAELNFRANRLARYLVSLGVGHETRVGLCVDRGPAMIVASLAILKAGGVYVPLDPAYPPERLAFMLADIEAPVVVTDRPRPQLPAGGAARVVCLQDQAEDIARQPPDDLPPCSTAESLAYVMYTSGSTGTPKGVEVPHRGVVRLVKGADYCAMGPDEVFLQLAPVCFDAATLEIWAPLLNGGRLVIYPEAALSLDRLGAVLRERGVTTLWLTAGLFHLVVDERVEELGPLRQLLAGGDVLSPRQVRRCLEAHPHLRLINGYGPTENTTFTCCHPMTAASRLEDRLPIGRPIANTRVYLLDAHGGLVPPGVVGELYAGGDGLARGYHRRPELTAERFVPDRFSGRPGTRLYHTGDLARYRADGTIEFLGRTDDQVKVRGFRIELGELESVAESCPGVSRAAAVARVGSRGDKTLALYFTAQPPGLDQHELRRQLERRLPDYMVPAVLMELPALPLSPNGKVDRKALPEPAAEDLRASRAYLAPRNETEARLVELWENLLNVRPIGVRDDFFERGGHSLLAVRLFAQIESVMGRALPVSLLFTASTVEALAEALSVEASVEAAHILVPLQASGSKPPLFILPGIGGHAFTFTELARSLDPDRPVYGLQAIGLDGREPFPQRIEEIAARYVREIQAVQSEGPYHLMGYSAGAFVAYEMAVQLEQAGGEVAFLAVIDCSAPGHPKPLPRGQRMRTHWRRFCGLSWRGKLGYLLSRIRSRITRIQRSLGYYPVPELPEIPNVSAERVQACVAAMGRAMAAYWPQTYNGDLMVLRSMDRSDWEVMVLDDPCLGWGDWARGSVTSHALSDNHLNLFVSRNIPMLAAVLERGLNRQRRDPVATCPAGR